MRKLLKLFGGLFLAVMLGQTTNAQQTINGKVTNGAGDPLASVNVQLRGTNTGTSTTEDGQFTLNIPSGRNQSLIFSRVGYGSKTISIDGGSKDLIIELDEDVSNLEQVVITGLATKVKRGNLANAVTSINAKELMGTTQIQTADGALYGKISGANIRMNGGAPGGGVSIQLRGISTLGGGSQPLIILDGVYINNSFQRTGRATLTGAGGSNQDDGSNRLADINPSEIENVEVLKGPSAAAIYGTRANNGVIIITTKKGVAGKTKISFNQDIGFGRPLRLLGTDSWSEEKINFFFTNPVKRQTELNRFRAATNAGQFFDHEDLFYGNTATLSNSRLSITGGNDKTRFFVNGSATSEDGIVKRTAFERYSIRANIDHRISQNVSISINSNFIRTNTDRGFTGNQNNTGASIGYNIAYIPTYFDLRPDPITGRYPDVDYGGPRENPLAVTNKAINNSLVNRFVQAGTLDWKVFQKNQSTLKFQLSGGLDYVQNSSMVYLPEDLQFQRAQANPGDILKGRQESFNTNLQAALVFNTEVKDVSLTTQAGLVRLDFENESLFVRGRGLAPAQTNVLQATAQSIDEQFSSRVQEAGIFAQQEANWQDKLIATLGVRFDKSSLNGDPEKLYAFPKASLAVNLTKFDFWKSNVINQLKPRIAYGETAGPVPFGSTFTPLGGANIGGLLGSVVSTQIGNTQILPESARELEFGVDAGFFNNRLQLEATYYIKTTANNIQNLNLSPATGVNTTPSNEAELENKGIELGLSATIIQKKNFRWSSRLLWWKNEVTTKRLGIPAYTTGAFGTGLGTFAIQQGINPLTIVGSPAAASAPAGRGTAVGFTIWGTNQPDFTTSWFNSMTLPGNLELSFLWEWREGGSNINLSSFLTDGGGTTPNWFTDDNRDGIPNGRQRPPEPFNNAGRWVQDASFIKLREIGLYYNIPTTLTNQWFGKTVEKIRVGFSGNNVLLFTNYEGYDPETSTFGSQSLFNNVDVSPYPTARRLFFHIGIDF